VPVPSRRSFLLTVGAGAVGVAASSASASTRTSPAAVPAGAPLAAPRVPAARAVPGVLVHVRDAAAGELGVLVGEREVVLRDPAAVAAILRAAGLS